MHVGQIASSTDLQSAMIFSPKPCEKRETTSAQDFKTQFRLHPRRIAATCTDLLADWFSHGVVTHNPLLRKEFILRVVGKLNLSVKKSDLPPA